MRGRMVATALAAVLTACGPHGGGRGGAGGSDPQGGAGGAPGGCQAAACGERECGLAYCDCDGEGGPEPVLCGECAPGEACFGSGVDGQCGAACETTGELREACAEAGQPSYWAFPAWCPYTFTTDAAGGVGAACAGCGPATGCTSIDVAGEEVACCPA